MMLLALALLAPPTPVSVSDTTLRLPRGTPVEIDAGMHAVELTTGPGDVVTIAGGTVSLGRALEVSGTWRTSRAPSGGPLRVTVPTWARVEVSNLGGRVTVSGAPEQLEITAINGDVSVEGGTGTMSITTVNGRVVVRGFAGRRLEVEAMTGAVEIDGATGTVIANTINDNIVLRAIRSGSVEASSVNGNLRWDGTFQGDGRYRFESHNGNVTLRLPPDPDVRLQVSTVMGRFDTRIQGTITGDTRESGSGVRPRDLTVIFGRGAARVDVETFNGNIRVVPAGET